MITTSDILADIRRAMDTMAAMPPLPFLASYRMLPADKAMSFKCDGRQYVGAHPDFWEKLPKTYHAESDPLISVEIVNLDVDLKRRADFFGALAQVLGTSR